MKSIFCIRESNIGNIPEFSSRKLKMRPHPRPLSRGEGSLVLSIIKAWSLILGSFPGEREFGAVY